MANRLRPLSPQDSPAAMLGAELRSRRLAQGLSLARLGQSVHVSGDLIGKIEKAQRRAHEGLVDRLDRALDAGGVLVRLAAEAYPGRVTVLESGSTEEPVEGLRGIVDGMRVRDHAMASRSGRAMLIAHARAAERGLAAIGRAKRPAVARDICEAYQLAGWMSFDHGDGVAAQDLLALARRWAHTAADSALTAYLMGPNLSFVATYGGRPELGVELAYGALGWARRQGNRRLIAFTMAMAARAHARLGEAELCLDLLDDAARELDRHDPWQADPLWLEVFDHAALSGHRGSCLLDLGFPDQAVAPLRAQDQAAEGRFVRNRVIWMLDRADGCLRMDEVDGACHDVDAALVALAGGAASARVARRFQALDLQLRRHAANGSVREVRDRLREVTAASG